MTNCACGSTTLQVHDGPTCGPVCHWCPNPATTRITEAVVHAPGRDPERRTVPSCEDDARMWEQERWWSVTEGWSA